MKSPSSVQAVIFQDLITSGELVLLTAFPLQYYEKKEVTNFLPSFNSSCCSQVLNRISRTLSQKVINRQRLNRSGVILINLGGNNENSNNERFSSCKKTLDIVLFLRVASEWTI